MMRHMIFSAPVFTIAEDDDGADEDWIMSSAAQLYDVNKDELEYVT
jgi:hypothetical protein